MPAAPDNGSQRPKATVFLLDQYDKNLLSASFLSQVAAGLFLCTLIFSLFLIIGVSNGSFGRLDTPALLSFVSVIFLTLATLFVWSCAITYMWRTAILVITLTICLALAAMATAITAYATKNLPNDVFTKFTEISVDSILSIFLVFRILLDGCRLAATRAGERALFATDPRSRGMRQSLAAVVGIHPICRWIPVRSRRVIAEMLFFLATAITSFGIAVVITLLTVSGGLINPQDSGTFFGLYISAAITGSIFALISGVLRNFARRFARVSAANLIKTDQRPPILFLRSFKDDQVLLARPKRAFIRGLLPEPLRPMLDHVLLEEFTSLGPLIAIGVPGAVAPFGASRTYVNEDEWKSVVAELARVAKAVVIVLDDTEGVNWEISHIVQVGHLAKTLCFLPPRLAVRSELAAQFIRRALVDNECTLAEPLSDPCIGWYRTPDGGMVLLVSSVPDQSSYVSALRLFRQRDSIGPTRCGPS